MSKIKELKSNTQNTLNLIDVLELFSPDKKTKYTETLLRLMKNTHKMDEHVSEIRMSLMGEFDFIKMEDLYKLSDIQLLIAHRFIESFFNYDDLRNYRKWCDYNERGLILQNDLGTYKSFDEVMNQLSLAELKASTKFMENQIVKLMDTEEWLVLRPLTFESSKKYGSNTKWCTTSDNNPDYFIKYCTRGVLIYCLNKITGYKVASFYSLDKNEPEFSFWNQKDNRIDSLDAEIPDEIRLLIQKESKDIKAKTNRFLLSDDERNKEDLLLKNIIGRNLIPGIYPDTLPESIVEEPPLETDMTHSRIRLLSIRNEERRRREELMLRSDSN